MNWVLYQLCYMYCSIKYLDQAIVTKYYYDSMFSDGELGSEMKKYMQLLYIKVGIKARSDLLTLVFLISRWHNLYRLQAAHPATDASQ